MWRGESIMSVQTFIQSITVFLVSVTLTNLVIELIRLAIEELKKSSIIDRKYITERTAGGNDNGHTYRIGREPYPAGRG